MRTRSICIAALLLFSFGSAFSQSLGDPNAIRLPGSGHRLIGPAALSPDGATLYLCILQDDQLVVWEFDVDTQALVGEIANFAAAQQFPTRVAISKDGTKLYVLSIFTTSGEHSTGLGQINVIDIRSGTATGSVSGLFGGAFALSKDGVHAYASATYTDFEPSSVLFIDLKAMQITGQVMAPAIGVGLSADGATLSAYGDLCTEIATATKQITAKFKVPALSEPGTVVPGARKAVAYHAYSMSNGEGRVASIDTTTRTVR